MNDDDDDDGVDDDDGDDARCRTPRQCMFNFVSVQCMGALHMYR